MSVRRSPFQARPSYKGNPIILARVPLAEWQAVHDYAMRCHISISEVIRQSLALNGVISGVITTNPAPPEQTAFNPPSDPRQPPVRQPRAAQPMSMSEALNAGLFDPPKPVFLRNAK